MNSVGPTVALCLVPVAIFALQKIEEQLGAARAGWMAGFPLIAFPSLLAISLQHGPYVGGRAAENAMFGVAGWLGFVLYFRFLANKIRPNLLLGSSIGIWLIASYLSSLLINKDEFDIIIVAIIIVSSFWLGSVGGTRSTTTGTRLRVRMAIGFSASILIYLSSYLGVDRLTGLLTTFPVLALSLLGPGAYLDEENARMDTKIQAGAMIIGAGSLVSFLYSLKGLLLFGYNILICFGFSLSISLVVHLALWSLVKWRGLGLRA